MSGTPERLIADPVRDYPTRLYWNNTELRGGLTDGHQHMCWSSTPVPRCPACDLWVEELQHSDGTVSP